jgi:hypothetical protein
VGYLGCREVDEEEVGIEEEKRDVENWSGWEVED